MLSERAMGQPVTLGGWAPGGLTGCQHGRGKCYKGPVTVHVSLPEALVLFALHDERGTIHPAAGLALDHALRGAVLSELRLRGCIETRAVGDARRFRQPAPAPGNPVLREALAALDGAPSPAPVSDWLGFLARARPGLRTDLLELLAERGILDAADRDHPGIERRVHPSTDHSVESGLRTQAHAALDAGAAVVPRLGRLVAFTVACHIEHVVFERRAQQAEDLAGWVADRDSIVRAAVQAIAEAEGRW